MSKPETMHLVLEMTKPNGLCKFYSILRLIMLPVFP